MAAIVYNMSDTSEKLIDKPADNSEDKSKAAAYEVIQALFFMVAFSTALGILGSAEALFKYGIESLLADFFILIFVVITYAINHHMMAYCCRKSSEAFNYAEFIEDKFGKASAMIYDVAMTVHNVVLLAYIQQHITGAMFEGDNNYADSYYVLAVINIPLIFISLTSDFKKIKWFCIVMMLTWIYVFSGALVEEFHSPEEYAGTFLNPSGMGTWIFKLVGLQLYFASAFQSLPFIYKEVKNEQTMKNVINLSSLVTLIVYFTVYIYSTFVLTETNYNEIQHYGLAIIGACAVVVNVIPARFSLAQFLSGNDSENMKKASSQDKLLSVLLIMSSIILSLFMVNPTTWDIVIGTGVVLSSILGIALPPFVIMFTKRYKKVVQSSDNMKKGLLFSYLAWISILAVSGIIGGFLIMIENRVEG